MPRGQDPFQEPTQDARSVALAHYLRHWAEAFSLSADSTQSERTAEAGMALLDAAILAEWLPGDDHRIMALSEAGMFETEPEGRARFVETPEIRAAIQRPLVSKALDGPAILDLVVSTALALDDQTGNQG